MEAPPADAAAAASLLHRTEKIFFRTILLYLIVMASYVKNWRTQFLCSAKEYTIKTENLEKDTQQIQLHSFSRSCSWVLILCFHFI